jgi:hypothetical protein
VETVCDEAVIVAWGAMLPYDKEEPKTAFVAAID